EDATTAVFINVHTNVEHENIVVKYDTKDYYEANHALRNNSTASTIKLDYLEQRGRRSVHSALIDGLTPETRYYVQVIYDDLVHASFDYVTR
ncbi:fibronectin type III domain-containing protein, partial [Vibrio parahaemolyticus]|uniref:fibronectin type III domain-containing protein n=1 Tax=Vibrio parahaemolyticus TaxID=670 RepID=UPI0021150CCB